MVSCFFFLVSLRLWAETASFKPYVDFEVESMSGCGGFFRGVVVLARNRPILSSTTTTVFCVSERLWSLTRGTILRPFRRTMNIIKFKHNNINPYNPKSYCKRRSHAKIVTRCGCSLQKNFHWQLVITIQHSMFIGSLCWLVTSLLLYQTPEQSRNVHSIWLCYTNIKLSTYNGRSVFW